MSHNHPFDRRGFFRIGLQGAAAFALARALPAAAFAAKDETPKLFAPPGAPMPPGNAKAVIQIWLWGGPPHIDTFDPKPDAGRDYCGPYNKALPTNVDGILINPLLPLLAKQADKYALLRGMTHGNNGHETAAYMMQTGRKPGGDLVYPGMGAVVTHFKAFEAGYKNPLPPYITLTTPQGRFSESGFMGSRYKPFATGGDPSRDPFTVEGVVAEGITEDRQHRRRDLLGKLDTLESAHGPDPLIASLDDSREKAYGMILGDAGKVFSLKDEKEELRNRYGRNRLGQSCLLARRLVERGVPFITINAGGWDTHKRHFQEMGRRLPELDAAVASLLQDLADHGLLESTLVCVGGEFGRTPKVDWQPPWDGGRSHYGKAFSMLVAGGGIKGGRVVGKTDEHGESVIERPIYPWDLIGTLYTRLGIDLNARLPHPRGLDVRVSPFFTGELSVKESGGLLHELL